LFLFLVLLECWQARLFFPRVYSTHQRFAPTDFFGVVAQMRNGKVSNAVMRTSRAITQFFAE
jgi:hypothetical protein